jgi:hypothetical protein
MQTAIDDPIEEAEILLGQAALRIWGALPRDAQEMLFESAVENAEHMRRLLAVFLHDQHPRTAHPIKPTMPEPTAGEPLIETAKNTVADSE